MNRLYYGDCFTVMQEMRSQSVDLIYLDPPFNSQRQYNAIYKDETGRPLPDQIEAFCDLFTLDAETEHAITTMPVLLREAGIDDHVVEFWRIWMNALRYTNPRLLAYLAYMAQRLIVMRRLLKATGSIYLHCDPTASHYIKVMMDGVFGHGNFRSEIIWKRTTGHSDSKTLGAVHDTILYYTQSPNFTYNRQWTPYSQDYLKQRYKKTDPDGRRWMDDNLTAKGLSGGGYEYEYKGTQSVWRVPLERMRQLDAENRLYFTSRGGIRVKRYLDEMAGVPLNDMWTDIYPINSQAKERLGYPTQKPLALLERIIAASSNEGDTVLDPFCGCATTLEAAHALMRKWIGIDIAIHAVKRVAKIRLQDRLGLVEGQDFTVEGIPRNMEGARDLWQRDKYHFQKWAVEQVSGFVTTRRSGDGGIDGRIYYLVPTDKPGDSDLQSMILEVKGGKHVGIDIVRSLRGVLEDGGAEMAGLIVLEPLSDRQRKKFASFMAQAGDLDVYGIKYQRMQLLEVQDLLEGRSFITPSVVGKTEPQPVLPMDIVSP